jgi:hypothetical protein
MEPIGRTLGGFLWFMWQSTHSPVIWIPLIVLLLCLWHTHRRAEPIECRKYRLLLLLPAVWIFVGLWGSYFWLDWQKFPVVPNPPWVAATVMASMAVFLLLGIGLIVYLRGARWFAAIYFVINLYFTLAISFLSDMAITGNWL